MGNFEGSTDDGFDGLEITSGYGQVKKHVENQIAVKKASRPRRRSFPKAEIRRKDETGTWLSPIEQPAGPPGMVPPEPAAPADSRHRKYIAAFAGNLAQLVVENRDGFKEPLEETYRKQSFEPVLVSGSRQAKPEVLKRSTHNCPIKIPVSIPRERAIASAILNARREAVAGALLYTWTENGWIRQGRVRQENMFLLQIRHHTKLEIFHDMERPVFCINAITFGPDSVDLRIMAIVKSEMSFLERAAAFFRREWDAYSGLPVVDHAGRVLIDERIIRRAGYYYTQYQRELNPDQLYRDNAEIKDAIRLAHFIVFRAHMPELSYNAARKSFEMNPLDEKRREAAAV